MRMNAFNVNFDTFQNLDADPADTIRTVRTLPMPYGPIMGRTDRYGRAIRNICRIRKCVCVCDWGLRL